MMIDWLKRVIGLDRDGLGEDVMRLPPEDAECLVDGRAISIRYHPIDPKRLMPHDEFRAYVHGEEVVRETVDMTMTVDTIGMFRVKDALGFSSAIGGIFGERNR